MIAVSTQMLNHYLELSANKQRLEVWFAQSALTGFALPAAKTDLLEKMSVSLSALQKLAVRDADLTSQFLSRKRASGNEFETLSLL